MLHFIFMFINPLLMPIGKLMLWQLNGWRKYGRNEHNLTMQIHCDQLLINSMDKVLESISMKEKIKGIYKGDILILIICGKSQNIRKIKFQIKLNAKRCFEELNKYFPVINHNMKQIKDEIVPIYQNVDDVIKHALNNTDFAYHPSSLSPSFKNFVKLCFLDPSFPQLVHDIQNVIETKMDE